MISRIGLCLAAVCGLALISVGCGGGPAVGQVTGIVTLDGEPVDQAIVSFFPTEGRASVGTTDSQGKYELTYTTDQKGAVLGEHKVTISTEIEEEVEYADSDYGEDNDEPAVDKPSVVSEARKESMPAKYRDLKSTELTATVKSGENSIDFALTSE